MNAKAPKGKTLTALAGDAEKETKLKEKKLTDEKDALKKLQEKLKANPKDEATKKLIKSKEEGVKKALEDDER